MCRSRPQRPSEAAALDLAPDEVDPADPLNRSADDEVLHQTGIREMRRKPVFTTPNLPPPPSDEQTEVPNPDFNEDLAPQTCSICKKA